LEKDVFVFQVHAASSSSKTNCVIRLLEDEHLPNAEDHLWVELSSGARPAQDLLVIPWGEFGVALPNLKRWRGYLRAAILVNPIKRLSSQVLSPTARTSFHYAMRKSPAKTVIRLRTFLAIDAKAQPYHTERS
jgi:hypothetical protein